MIFTILNRQYVVDLQFLLIVWVVDPGNQFPFHCSIHVIWQKEY